MGPVVGGILLVRSEGIECGCLSAGLDVQPIRKFCGVIVDNTIFRQLQENKSGTKSIKSAIMSAILVL